MAAIYPARFGHFRCHTYQWRRQDFVTGGGSEVWVYRGSRVRSPPVPVVLSVYQRGSLLHGLAMYLSCNKKKFHDNESTHILHNFWTSTHRGEASPLPLAAPLIRITTLTSGSTSRLPISVLYRESKKQDTKLLPITSPNVNRFSKFLTLADSLINLQ